MYYILNVLSIEKTYHVQNNKYTFNERISYRVHIGGEIEATKILNIISTHIKNVLFVSYAMY